MRACVHAGSVLTDGECDFSQSRISASGGNCFQVVVTNHQWHIMKPQGWLSAKGRTTTSVLTRTKVEGIYHFQGIEWYCMYCLHLLVWGIYPQKTKFNQKYAFFERTTCQYCDIWFCWKSFWDDFKISRSNIGHIARQEQKIPLDTDNYLYWTNIAAATAKKGLTQDKSCPRMFSAMQEDTWQTDNNCSVTKKKKKNLAAEEPNGCYLKIKSHKSTKRRKKLHMRYLNSSIGQEGAVPGEKRYNTSSNSEQKRQMANQITLTSLARSSLYCMKANGDGWVHLSLNNNGNSQPYS